MLTNILYMCVCVCLCACWTLLTVCSFIGHMRENNCDLLRKAGIMFPHSFFRQILKLNTNLAL